MLFLMGKNFLWRNWGNKTITIKKQSTFRQLTQINEFAFLVTIRGLHF